MKEFGYFTPNDMDAGVHAKDFVDDDWDYTERKKVIQYLISCQPTGYSYFERLPCYICNEYDALSSQDMVDGEWIFLKALIHYVEQHNVVPTQPFLEHIRRNNYMVPKLPDDFIIPDLRQCNITNTCRRLYASCACSDR